MKRIIMKRLLALFLLILPIAIVLYATNFPLKYTIENRIADEMKAQGLTDVKISVGRLTQKEIQFSEIAFSKNNIKVAARNIVITATNLPYNELLRGNYANIKAAWEIKALDVMGIPYAFPQFVLTGDFYTKDGEPVAVGEFHDMKLTHQAQFTITPATLLLENIHVSWEGAELNSPKVVYSLKEKKEIYMPVRVKGLALTKLLPMLSGDKATGTGSVSGVAELFLYPDGSFGLGDGGFAAESSGSITLAPDALPGSGPQIEMARAAFTNFHYENLSIRLYPGRRGKVTIGLTLEGSNPDAFEGRNIKLNVNLTGDVLEFLQQSLLPITDPAKYLEKDKP
jgi:hypothetical protein